jgi:putative MATE family efflux protein
MQPDIAPAGASSAAAADAPTPARPALLRMTTGRAVWSLAWPVIALGLARAGYYLADTYWAGRMGDDAPAALAALGVVAFAFWILHCLGDLAAVGTLSLCARAEGAGDHAEVRRVFGMGLLAATALGLTLAVFAGPLARGYFALVGFDAHGFEGAARVGLPFLRTLLVGGGALLAHAVIDSVFRAVGDTRTPLVIALATLIVNAGLDPWLIFGGAGLPALGLAGAAWATVFANAVAALVGFYVLVRRGRAPLRPAALGAGARALGRVLAIGFPQFVSGTGFCLVYVALADVLNGFGPTALGALGIGHRIEAPAFQICLGFSVAAATLVGQNLGAGDPRAAARAAHRAAVFACAAMAPFAVALLAASPLIVALWAPDDLTRARSASYLMAVGIATVPMALEVVYEGAFAGAGRTGLALAVLLPLTALRIPLAAYLAGKTRLGLDGVWVAIALTTALKGLLITVAFRAFGRALAPPEKA